MSSRNPISIEVLEILDAIERRGSFAKAAEELNRATSAVSYGVQKLEEQLGVALFQRQGRRSVLTPAGQLVLEEGRKILSTTVRLASAAKEVATGWEPRIRVAIESTQACPLFYHILEAFLQQHNSIEIDLSECTLNGGWEALDKGRVDLVVGAPGPVPLQKGFRAIPLGEGVLIPVIACQHPLAAQAKDPEQLQVLLPKLRRIILHDTSQADIARSEGLSSGGQNFYVQTIEQKTEAIVAGIGIGHLPQQRVQFLLDKGVLQALNLGVSNNPENFMAWKISNKGKGLQALTQMLAAAHWV